MEAVVNKSVQSPKSARSPPSVVKTPSSNGNDKDFKKVLSSTDAENDDKEFKGLKILKVKAPMKAVRQAKFNKEGDLLFIVIGSSEGGKSTALVYWTKNGKLLGKFRVAKALISCDVNKASTLFATAGQDGYVHIFNVQNGMLLASINCVNDAVVQCRDVMFSHDDSQLLVITSRYKDKSGRGGDVRSAVRFYNLPHVLLTSLLPSKTVFNEHYVIECQDMEHDLHCASWGPTDNLVYYGDETGEVFCYSLKDNKILASGKPHSDKINRIHFDPDYLTLVTASDDATSCLLNSVNLKVIKTYKSDVPVKEASVSPICDHVILGGGVAASAVTTSSNTSFLVRFYHKVYENLLGAVGGLHFGTINSVVFSPDGRKFASAGHDGYLCICTFPDSYFTSPGAKPIWTLSSSPYLTGQQGEGERRRLAPGNPVNGDVSYRAEREEDEEDGDGGAFEDDFDADELLAGEDEDEEDIEGEKENHDWASIDNAEEKK